MSENTPADVPATALGPIRPLSVRITDGLRAQLEVFAQLNDRSVTEEIRLALEAWVETSKSDPKVLERARDGASGDRARSGNQAQRNRRHLRRGRIGVEGRSRQAGSCLKQGGCLRDCESCAHSRGSRPISPPSRDEGFTKIPDHAIIKTDSGSGSSSYAPNRINVRRLAKRVSPYLSGVVATVRLRLAHN